MAHTPDPTEERAAQASFLPRPLSEEAPCKRASTQPGGPGPRVQLTPRPRPRRGEAPSLWEPALLLLGSLARPAGHGALSPSQDAAPARVLH